MPKLMNFTMENLLCIFGVAVVSLSIATAVASSESCIQMQRNADFIVDVAVDVG